MIVMTTSSSIRVKAERDVFSWSLSWKRAREFSNASSQSRNSTRQRTASNAALIALLPALPI